MKLIYINDELATGDGSNSHAVGMLRSFEEILGKDNVRSYPKAVDGSQKEISLKIGNLKKKLKGPLQVARFFRKKILSVKRSKVIINDLKNQSFSPTHVIARSTVFDITAIYVAKEFGAKLIYEVNTPMFYECGIIKKEPLVGAIEKWENKILEKSDYVYTVSSVCRDMLCKQYGLKKDKFLVIPNGYMSELYVETDTKRATIRDEVRSEEGLNGKFVVTFVGSLKIWHGIKNFCETAALMEENDNFCFLVLGDGEMHDMIENYTKHHSNMVFKGKVSLNIMKNYLYASDIGIMPYEKKDNFYYSPLKMFDMIGSGLPFIGTAVGQIEEFCNDELSSDFLAESNKPNLLRNLIRNKESDMIEMKKIVTKMKKKHSWYMRANILIKKIL